MIDTDTVTLSYIHEYIYIHIYMYIHICIYIYIHIYVHIHIHIHMYIHAYARIIHMLQSVTQSHIIVYYVVYTSRVARVILAQGPC